MINGLTQYKQAFNIESETVIQPGLANMEKAMSLLGEPQTAFKSIHLAGTNGKGSTLTYICEMAINHNLKVGTFMSPGIVDLHDQIQINGEAISKKSLRNVFQQLKDAGISGVCTDFELLTCAAFVYFQQAGVDVAIVEAGMGGRFDCTNVMNGDVVVIPSIALEHTNFLGDTLEEIAWHKAGIFKENCTAFIGAVSAEVKTVFEKEAMKLSIPLKQFGRDFYYKKENNKAEIVVNNQVFTAIHLKMRGEHQLANAALAVASFVEFAQKIGLTVDRVKVAEALNRAQLPFRFEEVSPQIYLDGAHNPASVEKLVDLLKQEFSNTTITFVVGMLADKDVENVLSQLEQVSESFYFMEIDNPRAMSAERLMQLSRAQQKAICKDILELINKPLRSNEIIVITGSLYLLSAIRQF